MQINKYTPGRKNCVALTTAMCTFARTIFVFSVLCEECISHQIGIFLTVGDFSFHLCNCASAEVLGLLAQSQGGKHDSDN